MVVVDREAWKAREAEYKAQRRKRSPVGTTHNEAKRIWDSVGPPVAFDAMIPIWQNAIARFVHCVREGAPDAETAWGSVAPSRHSWFGGAGLSPNMERALRDAYDEAC